MKIGLFDSGSGLFTVAQAIRRLNPQADLILYSDLANMPYGEKSQAELTGLMLADLQVLERAGADIYVSACNTLSVAVLQPIFHLFGAVAPRVIEMVEPIAQELTRQKISEVFVVGTPATVESGMYAQVLAEHGLRSITSALPGLAAAIEHENHPLAREIIQKHLTGQSFRGIGLLACTHYPLVKELFQSAAPHITWLDPAEAVARVVVTLAGPAGNGTLEVITSAEPTAAYLRQQQLLCSTL